MNYSVDVSTALCGLASGISVAAIVLSPGGGDSASAAPSPAPSAPVHIPVGLVSGSDGLQVGGYMYTGTPRGLEGGWIGVNPDTRATETEDHVRGGPAPEPNLAVDLKKTSGLGVRTLAKIAGVSHTRYYEWLAGKGMTSEHVQHMQRLLLVFQELRPMLGRNLRGFVNSTTRAGRVVDLLREGDIDAVLGLTLAPERAGSGTPAVSVTARVESGLPGWTRPVRRLNWNEPAALDARRAAVALDELAPSAAPEYASNEPVEDSEPAYVAHIIYK